MAGSVVALSILITKFEYYYYWQVTQTVYLDDKEAMKSFVTELSCLQALLLLQRKPSCTAAAIKNLETEITEFSLKVEADIEMQLTNILLAEDHTKKEKASDELIYQTLPEAAQNATELLKKKKRITTQKEDSSSSSSSCVSGGEMPAIAALTTLITKIEYYFFKPFSSHSYDSWEPIKPLLANLSSLQAFLQKESCSGALKHLEIQITDFALQAERCIERGMIHYIELTQDFALDQALKEAAKNAAELLEIINSASNNEAGKDIETPQSWIHWSKPDNSEFDENNAKELVGREHDYELLIRKIKELEIPEIPDYYLRGLKLISIVGMPGIGKTAVATILYMDKDVEKHFDVRCWITMPKTYNQTQMLLSLLASITPTEPNEIKKGGTPDELAQQVRKRLEGKRFLIVFDNFWNNESWSNIKRCFPDEYNGSRILLTTTHLYKSVYSCSDVHYMTLLDPDKSWELFCNTLSIKGHVAAKFEEIRTDVVEKCDGLPQLIIEVAKRLYKCSNIQQEWKKIEKELESLGILDRNVLIPSYNQLPQHLKVCFLYLGVFPKRYQIRAKMLIRLWIVEGFVKPLNYYMKLETQAYEYLQELIDRSLLLIGNQSSDGKIKTCRLHSAFHSFCVVEAQKEDILCAVNTQQHSGLPLKVFANSCRWLSFYSHGFDYYVLFRTNITRSILIFQENTKMFVPPKLLRVLAGDTSIFLQRVPLHLGDFIFLRYLSITQWFEGLDGVVSNNPNLHTLVVSNNESQFGAPTVHLPSCIWEAPRLRHLELGNLYRVDPPSMVKGNLQSLSCVFRPIHCRKEMYDKLPNIEKLKIFLKDDDIEATHACGSCSNPIVLDYLGYLEKLKKLTISVSVGCAVTLPGRFVFPSQLIELRFSGCNRFNTLTESSMFPLHLKKLRLSGTNLSNRDLKVIGMLPELVVLKLENAFHGAVWELSDGGFPNLRLLLLEAKKLKRWKAIGRDHFSKLQHLILRFCNRLHDIPPANIHSLKSIELESRSSLITSAKRIQEVQQKFGYPRLELKIVGPVYDESQSTDTDKDAPEEESQSTDTDVSEEEELASLTLSE